MSLLPPRDVEHLVDVAAWMTEANDDAPLPGRVLIIASCAGCETGRRLALPRGRWVVVHQHGHPWAALPAAPPPKPARRPVLTGVTTP